MMVIDNKKMYWISNGPETYDNPAPEITSRKAFDTSKSGFSKLLKSYPNAVSPIISNV